MHETLLQYNFHSNHQLHAALLNVNAVPESILKLICHIHNAQQIWTNRILQKEITNSAFDIYSLNKCDTLNEENFNVSLNIVKNIDLTKQIHYKNFKGQLFSNLVADILTHLVNHATYHRGQIALQMRLNGFEPVLTDYISYKRKAL